MPHITEISRVTGASVDEIRYLETKGFVKSRRVRLQARQVREYSESESLKVAAIIKYRRQGFTWDTAYQKALIELENPPLL
jgi:DNA-binding transcriptional MerR regulator